MSAEERARDWRRGQHAAVCDVREPWEHGTVCRATRYPHYWDLNLVNVERDPGMDPAALAAVAEERLGDLTHRRVDVELIDVADRLRPGFESLGWSVNKLVFMRHTEPVPPGDALPVEEVPYDAVHHLREAWHYEDFPGTHYGDHAAESKEVSLARGAQVFAVVEDGVAVAYTQLERDGEDAEIAHVYVRPDRRGRGMGTALTRAAIGAAGRVCDLWIVADDEDRPKELYARMGFRPAWRMIEFLRRPTG
jgi:GNAT superfamily N-acetyltransferase